MKKILTLILAAVLFFSSSILPVFAVDYKTYGVSKKPSALIITYYTGIFTRGFTWETSLENTSSELYILKGNYGESDAEKFEKEGKKINGTTEKYVGENDFQLNFHKAMIDRLEEDTEYSYRVGGDGEYLYGTFRTDKKKDEVTILNLNDAQTKDAKLLSVWEKTVAFATEQTANRKISFIAFGGDLFDSGFFDSENKDFSLDPSLLWGLSLDSVAPYIKNLPFIISSGNHEAKAENLFVSANNISFEETLFENNGGCYSFNIGLVHYVVLPYVGDVKSSDFKAVKKWLENDLYNSMYDRDVEWTVVQTHWGPYTTGDHGASEVTEDFVTALAPVFSRYHVDLVLQAHDHTYSKSVPYLWDSTGYETVFGDKSVVNLNVKTVEKGGITYDFDPKGTYYISVGAAGSITGENGAYANSTDGLYLNNKYKTEIAKVSENSEYFTTESLATADLGKPMYGLLTVKNEKLSYEFYVLEKDGSSTLIDTLRIMKTVRSENREVDTAFIITVAISVTVIAILGALVFIILKKRERRRI